MNVLWRPYSKHFGD
jgi:hypothetical protein